MLYNPVNCTYKVVSDGDIKVLEPSPIKVSEVKNELLGQVASDIPIPSMVLAPKTADKAKMSEFLVESDKENATFGDLAELSLGSIAYVKNNKYLVHQGQKTNEIDATVSQNSDEVELTHKSKTKGDNFNLLLSSSLEYVNIPLVLEDDNRAKMLNAVAASDTKFAALKTEQNEIMSTWKSAQICSAGIIELIRNHFPKWKKREKVEMLKAAMCEVVNDNPLLDKRVVCKIVFGPETSELAISFGRKTFPVSVKVMLDNLHRMQILASSIGPNHALLFLEGKKDTQPDTVNIVANLIVDKVFSICGIETDNLDTIGVK